MSSEQQHYHITSNLVRIKCRTFICVHFYCIKRVQTSSQNIESILSYRKRQFLSCRVYANNHCTIPPASPATVPASPCVVFSLRPAADCLQSAQSLSLSQTWRIKDGRDQIARDEWTILATVMASLAQAEVPSHANSRSLGRDGAGLGGAGQG